MFVRMFVMAKSLQDMFSSTQNEIAVSVKLCPLHQSF